MTIGLFMQTGTRHLIKLLTVLAMLFGCARATADAPSITATHVLTPPVIDGSASDAAWAEAQPLLVKDAMSDIPLTLRTVYTNTHIYWLVSFPDATESREQKTLVWNPKLQRYKAGEKREDTFVFKWATKSATEGLSVHGESPHTADIWYWKACRTDPQGYADDKYQHYVRSPIPRAKKTLSRNGNTFYLQRRGDAGSAAYQIASYTDYQSETLPRYQTLPPSGSRADIKAKGQWQDGTWTVEFGRVLDTSHNDDVQFVDMESSYHFGVSRYEIAGRNRNPNIDEPLFGAGDITELIRLRFSNPG